MRRIVAGVERPSAQIWAPGWQVETAPPYPAPVNRAVEAQVVVGSTYGAPPGWISAVGGRPKAIAAYRRDLPHGSLPVRWPHVPVIAPGISLSPGPSVSIGPSGTPYGSFGHFGISPADVLFPPKTGQVSAQDYLIPQPGIGGKIVDPTPTPPSIPTPKFPSLPVGGGDSGGGGLNLPPLAVGGYAPPIPGAPGVPTVTAPAAETAVTTSPTSTVADVSWGPGIPTVGVYAPLDAGQASAPTSVWPWVAAAAAALAAAGGAYALGRRRK